MPASPKTNFPAIAALCAVVIQALSFAGGVEKLNTKPSLDIAIAIAVALSKTQVPNIATLINRHYLALFVVPIEIGGKFVDCKASKAATADSGTVLTRFTAKLFEKPIVTVRSTGSRELRCSKLPRSRSAQGLACVWPGCASDSWQMNRQAAGKDTTPNPHYSVSYVIFWIEDTRVSTKTARTT